MNTTTLQVKTSKGTLEVEMPSATTARYAAKRVAEKLDLDPDRAWFLLTDQFLLIEEDLIVGEFPGALIYLVTQGTGGV
jgi:hypothetical protein